MENGKYDIKFSGDKYTYLAEKRGDGFYFIDGTGWESKIEYPELIISCEPVSGKPEIPKNYNYGHITYPLTEFFPRS